MAKSASFKCCVHMGIFFLCQSLHASFIEQTLGTAVVNDATAVYFNPAALTVLSQQQWIALGTMARSEFHFTGSAQRLPFGNMESGTTNTISNFFLPSFYLGMPFNERFAGGVAVVANAFDRELDDHSILRYDQARNRINDVDLVPALAMKINEFLSIGANINLSHAQFIQRPISGLPRLNIPESHSLNRSNGTSVGGDVGVLIKPADRTLLGLNYRSAVTYSMHGSSTLYGSSVLVSNNYHFKYWTPARSVASLSHFFNKKLGLVATAQYLEWDIFKDGYVYNFAVQSIPDAVIVPQAHIDYHFHNSWLLTLGSIYKISTKWIIRVAGTYNQSPADGQFQINSGDSFVLGSSLGYQLSQHFAIDASYAHAFFKQEPIRIMTAQHRITGINRGVHDSASLKLTYTV